MSYFLFTLYGNKNFGNKLQNYATQVFFENFDIEIYTIVMRKSLNLNTFLTFIKSIIKKFIPKYKISIINIIFIIICSISIFLVDSETSTFGMIIICLYVIFNQYINNRQIFNIYNLIKVYIFAFVSIVIFKIQNLFSFLLKNIGRDITFSGRTIIWESVFERIKLKPFFGYGNKVFEFSKIVSSEHNSIIGILYKTGLFGLVAFIFIIYKTVKKLYEFKNTTISKLLSFILFSYLIMMIFESYDFQNYMFIFVVCYNINYLIIYSNRNVIKEKEIDLN